MSYTRLAAGYTFRADITCTASYDAAPAVNVSFSANEHFDTIDDLLDEFEDRVATAIGAPFSAYVNLSVDVGKVFCGVGGGHNIAIVWGVGTENLRFRNFLGFAADLAPAAQTFLAPSVHLGGWYPADTGATIAEGSGFSGVFVGGRGDAEAYIAIGAPLVRPGNIAFSIKMAAHTIWTEVTAFRDFFAYVLDGETFGWWLDRLLTSHNVYRLSPDTDGFTITMDSPPNDSFWSTSFDVWREP